MLARIPIFIVARGNNELNIKKNKEALKFSYVFIKSMNLFKQTYIISDNPDMLDYAIRLGFEHTLYQECKDDYDLNHLQYTSIYNFAVKHNYYPDWFILLSIDALFINSALIANCIKNIDYNFDVITSYSEITNNSKFILDDNDKLIPNVTRITNEKNRQKLVDSTIYAISSRFAIECMQSDDPINYFWNGKFKFFKNMSVYTDIYEYNDIDKFKYIGNIIEEVKKINIE